MWSREYDLYLDTMLCCISKGLFNDGVVHLFGFDKQSAMCTVDKPDKGVTSVHWADNKIGVVELSGSAVPVGLEDVNYGLYILWICINDIILTIAEAVATTGT